MKDYYVDPVCTGEQGVSRKDAYMIVGGNDKTYNSVGDMMFDLYSCKDKRRKWRRRRNKSRKWMWEKDIVSTCRPCTTCSV